MTEDNGVHTCPAPRCTKRLPGYQLACLTHWRALPPDLQSRIRRAWSARRRHPDNALAVDVHLRAAVAVWLTPEPTPGRGPGTHMKADGRPKIGFTTRHLAERYARQVRGRGGPELHPYPCDGTCSGWHLSSSPRRTAP